MTQLYEILAKEDNRRESVPLTYEEFRHVFRDGRYFDPRTRRTYDLVWVQPVGYPEKRVIFLENAGGLNEPAVS